ncbi:MAG: hypothetical protein WCQ94_00860 [Lachnospiraceae bacterium]|jgi:hypothetical protein|nr:hypothetical protein [Lachnospiraceae bacterium]MDD4524501.1 hypothetical protein [Lachnospiraceae bacterium]
MDRRYEYSNGRYGYNYNRSRAIAAKRAEKGRRAEIILITAAFSILAAIIFVISGVRSIASERNTETDYKYYKSVTVSYGEDLDEIVDQYYSSDHYSDHDDYVDELCSINDVKYSADGYELHPGDHIIVAYYSDTCIH